MTFWNTKFIGMMSKPTAAITLDKGKQNSNVNIFKLLGDNLKTKNHPKSSPNPVDFGIHLFNLSECNFEL